MSKNFLKIEDRASLLEVSDYSNIAVLFLSSDFKVINYNEGTKQIYQWTAEDILGKSYITWCRENGIKSPISLKDNIQLANNTPILDVEIENDENVISWKIIPIGYRSDHFNEILLIGNNITKEKAYKAQMKNLATISKAMVGYDISSNRMPVDYVTSVYSYMEKIISCLPCVVFWKNTNFEYVSCNDLLIRLLNIGSRDKLIGKTDFDINISLGTAKEIREIDEQIIRTKLPSLDEEHHLELMDGRKYIYLLSKAPIIDDDGQVAGIVGVMVDITGQKKVERELIKSKEEAEAANKLKSEFIHNMEHDIRTPFAGILGLTNILDQLETDLNKKQIIKDIFFCAQELLDYSCGIIDFSRIEAGVFNVVERKFSLKDLLQSIVAIENPAAKMKDLDYIIQYDNDMPDYIIGDEYRLKRIFINLLSNAIKFTAQGFVKFTIISHKITENKVDMDFVVEDSGIGIEKERLHLIYEKFNRAMPSNQGVYKGQGLGLRIVKKFVEEMDGKIEIKSTVGVGSHFTCKFQFQLPSWDKDFEGSKERVKENDQYE